METRSLVGCWPLFRAHVVFFVAALAVLALASSAKVNAQTSKDATPARPNDVPADHYDPDDTKTYADVVFENRAIVVRNRQFTVHLFRPRTEGAAIPAIYACGDGGWRGLAPRTAQQLAHMGFAVAGIDSKIYLREFSSLKNPLTIAKLASDYVDIARALRPYATVDPETPVFVYGWSLGAGFAIAVGSDPATRGNWAGCVPFISFPL